MKFRHFTFSFCLSSLAIVTLFLGSNAAAQTPPAIGLDLLTAWQMAKVRDGGLAAAKYQELAVRQRMVQAQSVLGPSASASGSIFRQWADSNTDATKQFNSANFSLSLSYPLYRLPAKESLEQSKVVVEQSKIQVLAAEQELMIKVAQAYMDVLGAQDTLRAAQAQKRAAREQMLTLKRSFEAGNAARIDLQDSIARHDISQAQEISARNDLEVKRSNIQVITGSLEPELRRLKPEIGLSLDSNYNISDWVRQARTANSQVLISELGLELAQREVRKQGSANWPTVDLVSSIGRSTNPSVNLVGVNQTNAQIGIQLSIPIFTNGGLDAKSKEAVALYNKSSAELETARDQVEQLTRQASVRIASGRALIAALESAVESSQIALDTTVLAFKTGARVNLDVLNAQQQVFAQRRDLAKSRYDFLVDSLRLKLLSGSLSEADLGTFNQLLIPLVSN
jgi:outer membrane protein